MRVRIKIDGSRARLYDAETGEEVKNVSGYRIEHSAGRVPLIYISLVAMQVVAIEADALDVKAIG